MNIADLAAPFPPHAVHWRAQNVTRDGDKALALAYIDARDVMDRLDEVCGPANWQTYYDETPTGRVICKLSIRIDDEWICKSDGAGSTAVEGEKGGISDALKRAAVAWGVGRYLYDLRNIWAACESRDNNGRKQWVKWLPSAQAQFKQALGELTRGNVPKREAPKAETLSDDQQALITNLASQAGVTIGAILNRAGVGSLAQIPAADFDKLHAALNSKIQTKQQPQASA